MLRYGIAREEASYTQRVISLRTERIMKMLFVFNYPIEAIPKSVRRVAQLLEPAMRMWLSPSSLCLEKSKYLYACTLIALRS